MTAVRDPEALVRALAEEQVPNEPQEVQGARREHLVRAISRSIRGVREREERRARWRKFGALALAALVVLGIGVSYRFYDPNRGETAGSSVSTPGVALVRAINGTLVVTHAGQARVVAPHEHPSLKAGDELRTASDGVADVQTERSAIHVRPATQLSILSPSRAEERIRLASGRIDLEVSKQTQSPRSVVVETPNADVVVRGTVFSVSVEPARQAPVTRVSVTEGSVWVLHGGNRALVSTGEEWSSDAKARSLASAPPAPAAPVVSEPANAVAPAEAAVVRSARGSRAARRGESASPGTQSGTLAEENRMFQAAVEARNRGEDRRALELFGALLNRYPGGRLAEESRVERMRALHRLGESGRAASEARRYLSDFASGFARDEARSVALGQK